MRVYLLSLFFGKRDQDLLIIKFLRELSESLPPDVDLDIKVGKSGGPLMGGVALNLRDLSRNYPTMDVEEVLVPLETPAKVYRSHKGDAIRFWLDWYRDSGRGGAWPST